MIDAGTATGNAGGDVQILTPTIGASGSTQSTTMTRCYFRGVPKNLTSGSAATIASIVPANGAGGNMIVVFGVYCTNGTDVQTYTGSTAFAAVKKSGTLTTNTPAITNSASAVTGGTLTVSVTASAGGTVAAPQLTATSSLAGVTSLYCFTTALSHGPTTIAVA